MGPLADWKDCTEQMDQTFSSTAPLWKGNQLPFVLEPASFFFSARFGIRYAIIFALNAISLAASLAVRPAGSS